MEAVFPLSDLTSSNVHLGKAPSRVGPSTLVLLSPPDCPTTPLLIQSAVTHGCCGCNVLVVAPSRLHRLPPTVKGMPAPTPHTMASVRFLYAEDRCQLQRYLASVHLMSRDDRPTHLVVTHLQHYATHPPHSDSLSEAVTASKLLALLLETVHFTTSYRDHTARYPANTDVTSRQGGSVENTHGNEENARDKEEGMTGASKEDECTEGGGSACGAKNCSETREMIEAGIAESVPSFGNNDVDPQPTTVDPTTGHVCSSSAVKDDAPNRSFCTQTLLSPGVASSNDRDLRNHPFLRPRDLDSDGDDSDLDIETYQNPMDFSNNQYSILESCDASYPGGSLGTETHKDQGTAPSCELTDKPVEEEEKWKHFCGPSKCSGSVTVGWVSEGPPSNVLTKPADIDFVSRHLGYTVWSINNKSTSPRKQEARDTVPLFEASADECNTVVYSVTTDAVRWLTQE